MDVRVCVSSSLHAFYMLCFLYMMRLSLHVHGFSLYRESLCIHPMYRGV